MGRLGIFLRARVASTPATTRRTVLKPSCIWIPYGNRAVVFCSFTGRLSGGWNITWNLTTICEDSTAWPTVVKLAGYLNWSAIKQRRWRQHDRSPVPGRVHDYQPKLSLGRACAGRILFEIPPRSALLHPRSGQLAGGS